MTAIVISSNEQTTLTDLALDAITAFTPEPHEVWLIVTAPSRTIRAKDWWGRGFKGLERRRCWPWYSSSKKYAGTALADAFTAAREAIGTSVDDIFLMHNDALPLRSGWLSYLQSKPGMVRGVKASERNGAAHSSGVLINAAWLAEQPPGVLWPTTDAGGTWWDVAEYPSALTTAWTAESFCHRPFATPPRRRPGWWDSLGCDLSFDDRGEAFFCHRGGGSWLGQRDIEHFVKAAREALGLA